MSFKLEANPTFDANVAIPIPGQKPESVLFTFKHKRRSEFDKIIAALSKGESTVDEAIKEVVVKWKYPGVDFSPEALDECLELFPGSGLAIFTAFRENLLEAARKN